MHSKAAAAISDNVKRLMAYHKMTQRDLAREAQLSQSIIGYLLRYKDVEDRHPTTSTIEKIARFFELEAWQLMIPNLPIELMTSKRLTRLVENYRDAPDDGRKQVERVAESEVRYAVSGVVTYPDAPKSSKGGM